MKTIEVIDLEKLDSSAITVVDVRSSEDYSKGTFNNAISIPKSDFYNNVQINIMYTLEYIPLY